MSAMPPLRAALLLSAFLLPLPAVAQAPGIAPPLLAASCGTCHGPDGRGAGSVPPLDGLGAEAIRASMLAFRQDRLPATIMNRLAKGFTEAEIDALAAHLGRGR
jgi:sulfide dehydrogenase cytochrome subunit